MKFDFERAERANKREYERLETIGEIIAKTAELCEANPNQASHIAEMVSKAIAYSISEAGFEMSEDAYEIIRFDSNHYYKIIMNKIIGSKD